jgi:hypothetical protein
MLYVKATAFDGSIAGKGRGLHEVKPFHSTSGQDLWNIHNVHHGTPGAPGLCAAASGPGRVAPAGTLAEPKQLLRNQAQAALWAMLALLVSGMLALGPTLPYLPLYETAI